MAKVKSGKGKKKLRDTQDTADDGSTPLQGTPTTPRGPHEKKARVNSRHPALTPSQPDAGGAGPSSSCRKPTAGARRSPHASQQNPKLTVLALDLGHKTGMLLHTTVDQAKLQDDDWNRRLKAFTIDLDRVTHDGNNHTFDSGVKVVFGPKNGAGSHFEFSLEGDSKWNNRDSYLLYGLKSLLGVDDLDSVDDKIIRFIKQCGRGKFDILQDDDGIYLQDNHNVNSAPLYVDDALTVVIEALLEDLQEHLRRNVKKERGDKVVFMLTVPVNMSARRRNFYMEAVKEALHEHGEGAFDNVEMGIIEEQHASLIAMLRGEEIDLESMQPYSILTLDVGSTTTDAAIVSVSVEGGKLRLRVEMSQGSNTGGSLVTSEFRRLLMEEVNRRCDGNEALDAGVFFNPAVMDHGKILGIIATSKNASAFCPYNPEVANLAQDRCNVKDIPIQVIEQPIKVFEDAFRKHLEDMKMRLGHGLEPDRIIMVGGATKAKGRYNLQNVVEEVFSTASLKCSDLGKAAEGAVRYYLTKNIFDFDHQRLPNHIAMHVQDLKDQQVVSIAFNKNTTKFARGEDAVNIHWPFLYTDEMVEAEQAEIQAAIADNTNPQGYQFYQPITLIECRGETKQKQEVVEGTLLADVQIVAYHQLQVWCERGTAGQNIRFDLSLDRNYKFVAKSGREDVQHKFHMEVGNKPPGMSAIKKKNRH